MLPSNDSHRERGVRTATAVGALIALLITRPAWLAHVFWSPVLALGSHGGLPAPIDSLVHLALVVLLFPIIALPKPRKWLLAWCLLFLARTCWDRMLWQPYFLQYVFILGALACIPDGGKRQGVRREQALNVCRLVLAATYFWAGVAKIDLLFIGSGFDAIIAPAFERFALPVPRGFGGLVPLTEVLMAVGLLFERTRRIALGTVLVTHGTILLMVILGGAIQPVIWPWNIVLAILAVCLFKDAPALRIRDIVWCRTFRLHGVATLFFLVLPALSHVVTLPPYLSLRVYSFQVPEGIVYLSAGTVARLPENSQTTLAEVGTVTDGVTRVRLNHWAEAELGCFLPPAVSNFKSVARRLCEFEETSRTVVLRVQSPPDRFTSEWPPPMDLYCDQLLR